MRKIWLLLLCLPLIMACGALETTQNEACAPEGFLLLDDFADDVSCGWTTYEQGGAKAVIEDGAMLISTGQPGQIWWSTTEETYTNVNVKVTAQMQEGPQDNAFGVICGFKDAENFYVFLVSSDGFYVIGKYITGSDQIQYLTGDGEYKPTTAVSSGENTIEASCVDSELSLTVNGQLLETITEPRAVGGKIGVAASTFEPGTAVIRFDSVRVTAPNG